MITFKCRHLSENITTKWNRLHHYYRELLMKLGVIIWLHVIYCMSGGYFLISYIFQFFSKMSRKLRRKKSLIWSVIAQQETRNLLFNHLMTIPFLNLETHHSTLKGGWLLKKKSFLQKPLKLQDCWQHKHHTEFW